MEQKREANLLNEASVLDALDDDDDDKELSGDEDDKAVPRWKGKTLTQNKCAQVFNHFFFYRKREILLRGDIQTFYAIILK